MNTICKFSKGRPCPIKEKENREPDNIECVACGLSMIAWKMRNDNRGKKTGWHPAS